MKFIHPSTPLSIVAIMVALCLFAFSAGVMGLLQLLVALVGSGGSWHGLSLWFLVVVAVPFALTMLAGAIVVVSVPIAAAMFVNDKPARTPRNLIVAGVGALFAAGCVAWILS